MSKTRQLRANSISRPPFNPRRDFLHDPANFAAANTFNVIVASLSCYVAIRSGIARQEIALSRFPIDRRRQDIWRREPPDMYPELGRQDECKLQTGPPYRETSKNPGKLERRHTRVFSYPILNAGKIFTVTRSTMDIFQVMFSKCVWCLSWDFIGWLSLLRRENVTFSGIELCSRRVVSPQNHVFWNLVSPTRHLYMLVIGTVKTITRTLSSRYDYHIQSSTKSLQGLISKSIQAPARTSTTLHWPTVNSCI